MAKLEPKQIYEEEEEVILKRKKPRRIKFKTSRGKRTRYSCLFSTVANKSRAPPQV